MGHGVRYAADIGANLAKGTWDVGREKVGGAIQSFSQAARETLPGQVSTAIDNRVGKNTAAASDSPAGGATAQENSIGPGANPQEPMDPEVAAFVNKGQPNPDTTV
jgi:type IV secretion system protein TrbL